MYPLLFTFSICNSNICTVVGHVAVLGWIAGSAFSERECNLAIVKDQRAGAIEFEIALLIGVALIASKLNL